MGRSLSCQHSRVDFPRGQAVMAVILNGSGSCANALAHNCRMRTTIKDLMTEDAINLLKSNEGIVEEWCCYIMERRQRMGEITT